MAELDIRGILGELVSADVEFLLIGGVAVGYHGHVRATKDVDVVPAPDPANLKRLAQVLKQLNALVEGADEFDSGELPDPLDPAVLALGGNWVLLTRLGRLDIMQWIGDDALWERLSPAANACGRRAGNWTDTLSSERRGPGHSYRSPRYRAVDPGGP